MTSGIPRHVSAPVADWDVDAELQKELDAVSICSDISSSSSSAEAEECFSAENDADRTSSHLHKLLDNWRIKERKFQSFETMLSGTQAWNYDILGEISDQGQSEWPTPSNNALETYEESKGFIDPICRRREPASNDSITLGETSTSASYFSQQCAYDLPSSSFFTSCPRVDVSERVERRTENLMQTQEDGTMPTVSISNSASQDFDFLHCSIDYEDTLRMLGKRRMGMQEEYRAVEREMLVGKNLERQREAEESRKILLLDSQRRQELENDIWKEKHEKLALLDLEFAKKIEFFEELQRTEELDLEIQKLDMVCRSRSVVDQEEELELRRLEQDKTPDSTADQEKEHDQALQNKSDDDCVKYCIRIQSWIRGLTCRRKYQALKHRNAHSLVSLLLSDEFADTQKPRGPDYPTCEQHADTRISELSEKSTPNIHGQEYQQCGAGEEYRSINTSPEEILTILTGLAESGSMLDFKSCLDLATYYGLIDEARAVEDQLIQRKENVQSWLEQVLHGWDTTRSKIKVQIQEARRMEMFPILTVAEAAISGREKEIRNNLEAAIVKASRRNYTYWMRTAKNCGLEDGMDGFSRSFQRTIKMIRNCLKREAKLGTKEKYVVLFKNAVSLGLQFDVNLALKLVLERVLQVFKRSISLECSAVADVHSRKKDWNRLEMEGSEIGLGSETLAKLRQTIAAGRTFESVKRIWRNTFKADDSGGPFTISHRKYSSVEVADPINDASECQCQVSGDLRGFSRSRGFSLSAAVTPNSKASLSLPQNWPEMNRLQRDWQKNTLNLLNRGNDTPNYSQLGGYSRGERDCLPKRCARDKMRESTVVPAMTKNVKGNADLEHSPIGCLNSNKDTREEEEGSAEFSESEEHWRGVCQAQISEMLEHQQATPRKSTLTREMLEGKLGCNRTELMWVLRLDLSDEHVKSLGRAYVFRWCPRLRFVTVDMNKLTTLTGVFEGGEDCLEQLSVKDNLLRDIFGLECFHKLNILHLDGNLLSQLGFSPRVPILAKKERNTSTSVTSKNCQSLTPPLGGRSVVEYCWPRLKVLTACRNRLTKILNIGNLCPNLEVLDVGSNQIFSLGCTEDNSLAGLHHLRVLDVGQNRLHGRGLWKGLENCPELVSLVASRNKLRELPSHFGSVLLREIWLNGNAIKRLSCKAWLPSLQRLYLQDNMIDTLESLWGCPALEVLDLSFNRISEPFHLQYLSCFPCLRSLQLNDNPVSEQEDHVTCVLGAVPWLVELDNEAVTEASSHRAVTKIFKRIMDVVGIEFLREKLSRGEALLHGFSNPSVAHKFCLNNSKDSESGTDQFLLQREVNNVLNGKVDEGFLWEILSQTKFLASSSSIIQNLLAENTDIAKFEGLRRSFSESELEARSNMIAYQQMTLGLKGRLHAATKETCIARLLKERDQSVPCHPDRGHPNDNSCHSVPFLNLSSESHLNSHKARESNLGLCLEEHTRFDNNTSREFYIENKEYKLQTQTHTRRVVRLQALIKGHLTRIQVKLLRKEKTDMRQEQDHRCARKIQAAWRIWKARRAKLLESRRRARFCSAAIIQAHWRGYSIRQRFRRALDMAKYADDDDFEYAPIDDSEFIAGEIALSKVYQSGESIVSALSNPSTCPSKSVITSVDKNPQALGVTNGEGIEPAEWDIHDLHETKTMITPVDDIFQAPAVSECEGNTPAEWGTRGNKLTSPFEFDTQNPTDRAHLAREVDIHASHVMEASQGTVPADTLSLQETESLIAPKSKTSATQAKLEGRPIGPDILKEAENKKETEESEENEIAGLLERIGIDSDLNMHVNNVVSEGLEISEEVSSIIKGHLEEIVHSSVNPKDQKKADERDLSSIPAAEVKKRAAVEELVKDWGFKNEGTAQALLKARRRTQQQGKDVAHKSALQDPEKRLKRFRENAQGQGPAVAAPTRQSGKRSSLNFSGLTLQVAVDESKESNIHSEPEILYKSEISPRKLEGSNGPIAVPILPHQKKKSCCTERGENEKGMKKHPTSSTRDLSTIHLPTVVLNTVLQVSPLKNLSSIERWGYHEICG